MSQAKNSILLRSLSLGGYKSFGKPQRFENFSKINLLIGQNNSGKSNVLRFIHDIYPHISGDTPLKIDSLDRHLPSRPDISFGISIKLDKNDPNYDEFNSQIMPMFKEEERRTSRTGDLLSVFQQKAKIDQTDDVWFEYDQSKKLIENNWKVAFEILDDNSIYKIWSSLTGQQQGGRSAHWVPETIQKIKMQFSPNKVVMIPAIRQVGVKGSISDDFSGEGIIEKLVKLQNPDVHNQQDRKKFDRINDFLRRVTDNNSAKIEIPHDRDTILVHMDGKTLPLESLGTGIHEVIILAAAATTLENTIICMEEPELHLNPILQKKLVRYLLDSTENQYFISTHSAALMDTPSAETYHIRISNNESIIERVTSDKHRSAICEDLGYHPSDLLQSNCIVWVEGPSDRIYINYWLHHLNKNLIEGIHYSIMFYGGRLASHISGDDQGEFIDDFISLRRLNRRAVIVIDSDKTTIRGSINKTKNRLQSEFDKGPGYAWITKGREIENYLDPKHIEDAINATKPSAKINSTFGQFENTLSIITKGNKEGQASKVDVANYIISNNEVKLEILDLNTQIKKLVEFISESNPSINIKNSDD